MSEVSESQIDDLKDSLRELDSKVEALSGRIDWLVTIAARNLSGARVRVPVRYTKEGDWGRLKGDGNVQGSEGKVLVVLLDNLSEYVRIEATDVEFI
jgi:hypothetical protein